jgi:hypothetical protein
MSIVEPITENDPRLKGWLIKECPRGHFRFYHYLYWREKGKLKKEYVPLAQVLEIKKLLRSDRKRRQRIEEKKRARLARLEQDRQAFWDRIRMLESETILDKQSKNIQAELHTNS